MSEREPESDDDRSILMIVHTSGLNSWDDNDIHTVLVQESEVMTDAEDVQTYDYSLTEHARMVANHSFSCYQELIKRSAVYCDADAYDASCMMSEDIAGRVDDTG